MDPDSRFGIGRSLASSMAEASYFRNDSGKSQDIPDAEIRPQEYSKAMQIIAAQVGSGWTAKAIVNSGGDVAIGFTNPNGDPAASVGWVKPTPIEIALAILGRKVAGFTHPTWYRISPDHGLRTRPEQAGK